MRNQPNDLRPIRIRFRIVDCLLRCFFKRMCKSTHVLGCRICRLWQYHINVSFWEKSLAISIQYEVLRLNKKEAQTYGLPSE